jgi:hypothetical protein
LELRLLRLRGRGRVFLFAFLLSPLDLNYSLFGRQYVEVVAVLIEVGLRLVVRNAKLVKFFPSAGLAAGGHLR